MQNNYDVLIRFILDQSSQQKTKTGVDALNKGLDETEKHVHDINAAGYDEGLIRAMDEAARVAREKLNPAVKDIDKQIKATTQSYRAQARVLRSEAAAISSDFAKAQIAQIKSISDRIGGISRTGLVAGTAAVGGILAEANRFAKEEEDAGRATRATREWTNATKELAEARARVDTVLLRESLPLLKEAANIATQASQFIAKNPEIVQAVLKAGVIAAGLGALGIAVSKGIRLYADIQALALGAQELAAAKLQDLAADKQLIAARAQAKAAGAEILGGGKTAAGAGGLLAGAASPAGIATLLAGNVTVAAGLSELLDQLQDKLNNALPGVGNVARATVGSVFNAVPGGQFLGIIDNLKKVFPQLDELSEKHIGGLIDKLLGLGDASKDVSSSLDTVADSLGKIAGSAHESEIVGAFQKWKEDDARIVAEATEKRIKIISEGEERIAAETARFTSQISGINTAARKREESLTTSFLRESTRAEADYQRRRAEIIRDGGEELRDIEERHQEQLRKMIASHNERVEDLTASRDALGLAKEQRRFDAEQAESNRETREEIAKRRADIAERLAELDQQHQLEKAQRLAQFEEALAENEAQRKEQLKVAAEAHANEMKQIRAQRAQQLRELAEGLNAERARRREVFIAEIRDLDASLLGEKNLKARYYNLMLADAERFLAAYRARLGSLSATAPSHDFTGYAYTGMYRMAVNGQPEYVLSGAATRAAENMIGGRLTQDALLNALANGSGRQERSLTINDHSRFDGRISTAQVRSLKQEVRGDILKEFGLA